MLVICFQHNNKRLLRLTVCARSCFVDILSALETLSSATETHFVVRDIRADDAKVNPRVFLVKQAISIRPVNWDNRDWS